MSEERAGKKKNKNRNAARRLRRQKLAQARALGLVPAQDKRTNSGPKPCATNSGDEDEDEDVVIQIPISTLATSTWSDPQLGNPSANVEGTLPPELEGGEPEEPQIYYAPVNPKRHKTRRGKASRLRWNLAKKALRKNSSAAAGAKDGPFRMPEEVEDGEIME